MKKLQSDKNSVISFIARKEVVSVSFIMLFFLAVIFTLFLNPKMYIGSISAGEIAMKDIYAPYDFSYQWGIDEINTRDLKAKLLKKVPRYLSYDGHVVDSVNAEIKNFMDTLERLDMKQILPAKDPEHIRSGLGVDLDARDLEYLAGFEDKDKLRQGIQQIVKNIYGIGYISDESMALINREQTESVVIYTRDLKTEITRKIDELITEESLGNVLFENTQWYLGENAKFKKAVTTLLKGFIRPNLEFDSDRTIEALAKAEQAIEPVYNSWTVKKNEKIADKGERVTSRHVIQVSKLEELFRAERSEKFFLGILLLLVVLGASGCIYLRMMNKSDILERPRDVAIIVVTMLFMLLLAEIVLSLPQPSYFIPMASMGMMLMLILGFDIAFLSVFTLSLFISVLAGGDVSISIALIVGGLVGIIAVKGARRRSSILIAGLMAGAAKSVVIFSLDLAKGIGTGATMSDAMWGMASGVLSGFIVMGLLPVLEHLFKAPTNISLLEMSDLNHPVLKRLAMEAPGTYHHSVIVGNLAEAACDSIKANSLLARVGAYYHDIGKISKPQYFNENEMGGKSRHSGLAPSMSALIIANHIKEGMEFARKYKVSGTIMDFIRQHHGDSLISFFYQKALEKVKEDDIPPDEKDFRYPGPRPQSKETAIVLLADAVEASSRSLQDPTPASVRHLVKKVVNNKFIDGQLDECDLTLKDMHNIYEAFVRTLTGIFHTRTSYPDGGNDREDAEENGKDKLRKQA
ncbi:MAG: HDIG domain-containing protein [Candidatus Omnitrophica bacterium]|nr:HDIG domain-containing protein [Candidatus Omnitrophota bacterium]